MPAPFSRLRRGTKFVIGASAPPSTSLDPSFRMARRDELFGLFRHLHDGRAFGSTGVGLAIVSRVVERCA